MRISNDLISEIADRNDIVEVLGEYISLKRSGDNYSALCPFHSEKTPSFVVSRNKQIFKCFGCGESGNVISFIMKYKGVDFLEAVKSLAARVGITINQSQSKDNNLDKYYKILNESARYFYINLKKNKNIKQYLIDRGLSEKIITKFGLGYSLSSFDDLSKYLLSRGYNNKDLLELGLISQKGSSNYDRFINRIMFPIFNNTGKVIGFGGRVLDDRMPKYLNSKDSLVFKKGNNLYGLNFLLKDNNKFDYIIIVEGYMDCITLHNHGISNTVASLGTAFTIDQIRLLTKYTSKVYLCFDNDSAGEKATVRTFDLFKNFINDNLLEVYVLELKGAKDPDEFLKKYDVDKFLYLIDNSRDLIEYILDKYRLSFNLQSNMGKKKYLSFVSNVIKQLNIIDRKKYISIISKYLSIDENFIEPYFADKGSRFNNDRTEISFVDKAYLKSERQLLNLMLNKEYLTYILNNNVDEDLFSLEEHKKAFILIRDFDREDCDILKYLESELITYEEIKLLVYFKEDIINYDNDNIINQIDDFIKVIRKNMISNFKEKIAQVIKKYESNGNEDKVIECLSIFNTISKLESEDNLSDAADFIKSFEV